MTPTMAGTVDRERRDDVAFDETSPYVKVGVTQGAFERVFGERQGHDHVHGPARFQTLPDRGQHPDGVGGVFEDVQAEHTVEEIAGVGDGADDDHFVAEVEKGPQQLAVAAVDLKDATVFGQVEVQSVGDPLVLHGAAVYGATGCLYRGCG